MSAASSKVTLRTLADKSQWVAWQLESRNGKMTKVPIAPSGRKAKANDSATWGVRAEAVAGAARLGVPGQIGIQLAPLDGLVSLGGIDLDTCRDPDTGNVEPWALEIIKKFATYTEVSPSKTGLKIYFCYNLADLARIRATMGGAQYGKQWKRPGKEHPPAIEMYLGNRYFAVTDIRYSGTPVEIRLVSADILLRLIAVDGPAFAGVSGSPSVPAFQDEKVRKTASGFPDLQAPLLDAGNLAERTEKNATSDARLRKPWSGDWCGLSDQSRSGQAFALGAALKSRSFSFEEMTQALLLHSDTRAWTEEKGLSHGGREITRIWENSERKKDTGKKRIVKHASDTQIKPAWLSMCQKTDNGEGLRPNLANALLALREDANLTDLFAYDRMLSLIIVTKAIPGTSEWSSDFTVRPITDNDVFALQEQLQLMGLENMSKSVIQDAISLRAEEKSFHPVRDYLNGLQWDGTNRLATWLHVYLGSELTSYVAGISTMFVVAMVARIFEPGCKADYMLVLEGGQGIGKSAACAILGGTWFSENLPDLRFGGKDVAQHLRGRWLIEVAELSALDRAGTGALKAFVSRTTERYRPPFGRNEVVEPRQSVFIGTTNQANYLRDDTGGRRFWPVKVTQVDTFSLQRDRDQLFAEAVVLFKEGVKWWPTAAFEKEHIMAQQESRFETDPWEVPIAAYLATKQRVTVHEIAQDALAIDLNTLNTTATRRISAILQRLRWTRAPRKSHERPWIAPNDAQEFPDA